MRPTGADWEETGHQAKYLGLHIDFSGELQTVCRRLALGVTCLELNFDMSEVQTDNRSLVGFFVCLLFVCF